jgi:hypothetical protein
MLAIFGAVLAERVPPNRLEALAPCRRATPLESAAAMPNGKRPPRLRLLD